MSKIHAPNYTQVPNIVLDSLHELTGGEAKVMLAICRQTFGWQRTRATLSRMTIGTLTGLSNRAVRDSVAGLLKISWIERDPKGCMFSYRVNIEHVGEPNSGNEGDKKYPTSNGEGDKKYPHEGIESIPHESDNGIESIPLKRKTSKERKEKSVRDKREPHPERQLLIDDWSECYQQQFGRKYGFQGGKDAKAINTLLAFAGSAQAVMDVATRAWSTLNAPGAFWRKQAITIAGLACAWNNLIAELEAPEKPQAPRANGTQSSVAKRMALEAELKRINSRLEYLKDELQFAEARTAHPELVTERAKLRERSAAVEEELSKLAGELIAA